MRAARSARLNVRLASSSSSAVVKEAPPSTKSQRNPRYIPPSDGRCVINLLPVEILAHAFELGTYAELDEEGKEDEEIAERFGGAVSNMTVQEDDGDEDYEDMDEGEEEELEEDEVENDEVKKSEDIVKTGGIQDGTKYTTETHTAPDRHIFPVLASHVCRHWRRVALETPQLWAHICVDESSKLEEIAEWISRSKSCPLDVDIDIDDGGSDEDYDAEKTMLTRLHSLAALHNGTQLDEEQMKCFNPIDILYDSLRLLIPHMDRWQKFILQTVSFPSMLVALYQISLQDPEHARAPLLEVLWLSCSDEFVDIKLFNSMIRSHGEQAFRLFGYSPNLQDVSLWGVPIAYNMLIPSCSDNARSPNQLDLRILELAYMPWTELRPTHTQLAAILRGAPNLENLKIRDAGFSNDPAENIEPVRLPALRHLELSDPAVSEEALTLIRFLHAPALKSLYLDFEEDDFSEAVRLLATQPMVSGADTPAFIVKPFAVPEGGEILLASVRDLRLAGLACSEEALVMLYRASYRVQKLFLNMNCLTLEAATKLCLPWDKAVADLGALSPQDVWEAKNGVLAESGQTSDVTSAATAGENGTFSGIVKENIPLPELTELTTSGMSGPDIIALVMMRKEMRVPLKFLGVDRRDKDSADITEDNWLFLKRLIGKVDWVKVDTEDSDDDDDDDDDDDATDDDVEVTFDDGLFLVDQDEDGMDEDDWNDEDDDDDGLIHFL